MKLKIKPRYGEHRPTLYELLYCRTNKVVKYRGYKIRIYSDDYGQQFYAFIDNNSYSFGSYNFDYIKDIKYIIDDKLDTLYRFTDKKYFGAVVVYANKSHTADKNGNFTILRYKGEDIFGFTFVPTLLEIKNICPQLIQEYVSSLTKADMDKKITDIDKKLDKMVDDYINK